MGNAVLHGQYCIFQFNEDHQRSHDEGSLRGVGHRLPKKYWLWNVQQRGSLSPPSIFLYGPVDWNHVFALIPSHAGSASHFDRHDHAFAWWAAVSVPYISYFSCDTDLGTG